ncbi:YrhB domain-containing protein [Ideonella sp. DXS29W]|uniref:YrhB domain-containing protein n=1 Tax=Ideonella lacteola TaxID=2984193 RepID=A0ABU9C1T7_9BURK
MQSTESAGQSALTFLGKQGFGEAVPVLIDSATQEFDEGWVFFYQSKSYVETGDFNESLVGNAPCFVPRNGSAPCFISYHRPIEESMRAFRLCGDASAEAKAQVKLLGWEPGALSVSAIQVIRRHSMLGLAAAKKAVDSCLSGSPTLIDTISVASASVLVAELSNLNFLAEVTYGA